MGFGDDMPRFNGIGERITGGMYNNNAPDAAAKAKFLEIVRWAAKQGLTVTIHWQEDKSVRELLDLYEEVNKETPIAPLRWSIAHLDNASAETLARMKALGDRLDHAGRHVSRAVTVSWRRPAKPRAACRPSSRRCARASMWGPAPDRASGRILQSVRCAAMDA